MSLSLMPDFPAIEKKWLAQWEEGDLYTKYRNKNASAQKRFSFIDGPITANNPMGVHHGWGRTYKDIWQRFHNMLGYRQRFQNGFDCQGLWVEVEVEKQLGIKNKKDIENIVDGNPRKSIERFVALCKERVLKYAQIQTQQSKRLGYFMDWDHSYFTMSDENNYMIWHFLKVVAQKGWLYKGTESVPWCPRCETAISQHEMLTEDYKEVTHEAIYLALPVSDHEHLLVWTTTPWTIPANIAVAVDPELTYALVRINGSSYWIAQDAVERVIKTSYKVEKVVKGSELVGKKYRGPFDDLDAVKKVASHPKFHTVIATDPLLLPISTLEGTGLVHTAVSAGVEDYKLGKKYQLPMIPVISDDASYLEGLGFLTGQNAKKNPRIILDYLSEKKDWAFEIHHYTHRYPACWRCKTELVWKVEDEWYIAMDIPDSSDKQKRTFRQQMMDVAREITWKPSFGLERELDWLKNMHDWLISKKNRYWGLALPIYECKCGEVTVIGSKRELKERAVEGWDEFEGHTPHKPWIDDVTIRCTCGKTVNRTNDVGNVWLDAGIVPYSTLKYQNDKNYWNEWFPADIVTESFPGQFKNWFYALIAMSTALEKKAPFKNLLGYATVLDEKGKPMHKSWGNMIEFNEAADTVGVDVMRWLYARQDPTKNLLFGYHNANELKRSFHLPLWNSVRFFLTYTELDEWKKKPHTPSLLDQWIMARTAAVVEVVHRSLSAYDPYRASAELEGLVLDLSQWYIRLSRSRVWNNSDDTNDKNAFYSTLQLVLETVVRLTSIFLPFFSEELYEALGHSDSVHVANWPQLDRPLRNPHLVSDMEHVRLLAQLGHSFRKEREIKVRQRLSRALCTIPKDFFHNDPSIYAPLLQDELNVAVVEFKDGLTSVELDTTITPELEREGKLREIIRTIQQKRKELGCAIDEYVEVTIPSMDEADQKIIARRVLASTITTHKDSTVIVHKK